MDTGREPGWLCQTEHPSLAGKMLDIHRPLESGSCWLELVLTGSETEAGQAARKGDAKRDPLEGEPERSCGNQEEEFHVAIPQAFQSTSCVTCMALLATKG